MTIIEAFKVAATLQTPLRRNEGKWLWPEMSFFSLSLDDICADDWTVDFDRMGNAEQRARLCGLIQKWLEEDEDDRL